jgi:hypothetical protein
MPGWGDLLVALGMMGLGVALTLRARRSHEPNAVLVDSSSLARQ